MRLSSDQLQSFFEETQSDFNRKYQNTVIAVTTKEFGVATFLVANCAARGNRVTEVSGYYTNRDNPDLWLPGVFTPEQVLDGEFQVPELGLFNLTPPKSRNGTRPATACFFLSRNTRRQWARGLNETITSRTLLDPAALNGTTLTIFAPKCNDPLTSQEIFYPTTLSIKQALDYVESNKSFGCALTRRLGITPNPHEESGFLLCYWGTPIGEVKDDSTYSLWEFSTCFSELVEAELNGTNQ